ncbi:MAG TPA: sigma-70 family RNA polymerase sigma factor [Caldilineae bacterium]|nr:sigma-70 family RNA polymerase sigma factor [Caldilineae bacterium]
MTHSCEALPVLGETSDRLHPYDKIGTVANGSFQALRGRSYKVRDVNEPESTWIQEAQRGDRAAFAKLVESYQTMVYNLAYRMLGNAAEAEDAAQETFLRAYTRLHTYRPEYKFSTWLLSIASHYCIDQLRRRRLTWLSTDEEPVRRALHAQMGAESPERAALEAERREEIQAMLNALDPMYRAPIILRYWYDLSYREIAEVMGITEAAVKTRLHRARLQLARHMQEGATDATMPTTAANESS